jgi:KDO2-lipid IV(A) lauroyltransferase
LVDLIGSLLVRGINLVFSVTPMRFNIWFGRRIGALIYIFSGRRARVTYANLKAAFEGEKSLKELRKISRDVYRHVGGTFAEMVSMTKMNNRYINEHVKVMNIERIETAARNPGGMLLVSAHFGNWELSTYTSVVNGFPLYVLARDQKMQRLNELLNKLRESKGNIVVRKGLDVKNIFRLLRGGKSVGLLADQNAGASGELIDFFGRPASTATGPYRFAEKTGAAILPAFIRRVDGPYHELHLEEPMFIEKNTDIIPYMERYSAHLEKHMRACPDQWFWMHKRWKKTPVKKILVLDDGKKGHFKQSMAVVKVIRKYREDKGFKPCHTEIRVVPIKFRSRSAKGFLNALSPFAVCHLALHLKLLKMCLEPGSFKAATEPYADVIVSCGSSLFGVNRLLKIENMARNVSVLDPGAGRRKNFDVVIIPRHDAGKAAKEDNMVVTDLAPNLIDTVDLALLKNEILGSDLPANPVVGLLIGGSNQSHDFNRATAAIVAGGVKELCGKLGAKLRVTTSRRTPDDVEEIFERTFKGADICDVFVSGRADKDARTVEKILAVSDLIIVSGESISMVSEAVSSGKSVAVFMPDKKSALESKYERFVKNLIRENLARLVAAEEIASLSPGQFKHIAGVSQLNDTRKIYAKIHKLF